MRWYIYVCMYVRTYVCMYVRTYICMYVWLCMYVCTYVCMYVCMYVCTYICLCMYVCTYVYMYVCTYVRMYVCMYVRMYVCMYVCMFMYVRMYACMCDVNWDNFTFTYHRFFPKTYFPKMWVNSIFTYRKCNVKRQTCSLLFKSLGGLFKNRLCACCSPFTCKLESHTVRTSWFMWDTHYYKLYRNSSSDKVPPLSDIFPTGSLNIPDCVSETPVRTDLFHVVINLKPNNITECISAAHLEFRLYCFSALSKDEWFTEYRTKL